MYISQLCKTRLLTTSCALLLLSGAASAHAQTTDSIDYLYVSPQGNDSWSGQAPVPTGEGGPFQTLFHAQQAVKSLTDPGLTKPVEVVFDPGVCDTSEFVSQWFTSTPTVPVIWHSDSSRTVLIYTPTSAQQNAALSAEDYMTASSSTATARFYVSPAGSDAWTGKNPSEDADKGPFLTLSRAQDAVNAFQAENPNAPVEVVFEESLSAAPIRTLTGVTLTSMSVNKLTAAEKARTATKQMSAKALKSATVTKSATGATVAAPHLVFAHYTMAAMDYGGSVASYEHDIQDAQAAGVDGFAMNCGQWNGGNYKSSTANMFQAAHALNTGFKLFFSADLSNGLSAAEIQDMVKTYGNDPYYYHYLGRPVLSSWGGDGGGPILTRAFWLTNVLTPLRNAGYNVYFAPQFAAASVQDVSNGVLNSIIVQATYQATWKTLLDGLFPVTVAPPMNYAYSRTVPAVTPASGQQAGLTVWDFSRDHFYDPTNEFTGDDIGRKITIVASANFAAGTYTITRVDGGYPVSNLSGKSLGKHNLITVALGNNYGPAKSLDATGGGYTVQSISSAPTESADLVAQETYAQVMHTNGKQVLGCVSPEYWGSLRSDVGRRYNEYCGGEGLAAQWNSIINVQMPEWVELFTWNDFSEDTYFSPIDDVAKYWPYTLPGTNNNVLGYMKSHAGFTALNKYFINWYKTGVKPATTGDSVYYFYRTQPMNMVATNDPLGPVTQRSGPVADVIYITTMLSSPATLKVSSGSATQTFSVLAGTNTLRVPFSPGAQTFTLSRNGVTVLTKQGEAVVSTAPTYNFSLYSGSMTNQSGN